MMRTLTMSIVVLGLAASAAAQPSVFVVRHAERADTVAGASPSMTTDPDLSDVGHARAASLATALKDAGITAIYVTEYKRTQQTAAPLAKALGLTPIVLKATDADSLSSTVGKASGNVLVVGHSNTIVPTIEKLGGPSPGTIRDTEFDNLFILTLGPKPSLLRLHYR